MAEEKMHKHTGVERSNGTLRTHPVSRVHTDPKVQKYHNEEISKGNKVKTDTQKFLNTIDTPTKKSVTVTKKTISVPIDCEGYVYIDLSKIDANGCKIKFERYEGNGSKTIKRLVGVRFEKE
jgi:hypothetical protein